MPATHTRPASGVGRRGMAVLLILLLVGSALLMHTLAGHTETHAAPAAGHSHSSETAHAALDAALDAAPTPVSSAAAAGDDCAGMCAMLCAIMGMACLMALVLFAWSGAKRRHTRPLFVLSKALSGRPVRSTVTIPRLPPALEQLSILRV